jgi:intraflagellar transport protein 88
VYDQAIQFFEKACLIQPTESKWPLLLASCYRRSGSYQLAFETYKSIHEKFPDNVECLRFLVRICTDLGMKNVNQYINKLSKAERAQDQNQVDDKHAIVKTSHPANYEFDKVDPHLNRPSTAIHVI